MVSHLVEQLASALPQVKWRENFKLASVSYFKIGGAAAVLGTVKKEESLVQAVRYCHDSGVNYRVVGGLSNLIIADEGYPGVIIHNLTQEFDLTDTHEVYASSGWRMGALAQKLIDLGLGGLEEYLSLPGTLGGAIYNNAHFQSDLISHHLRSVKVFNPQQNEVLELDVNSCGFGYDQSCFQENNWVILGANLQLAPISPEKAQEKAKAASQWRFEKQPLNLPSAGCIFQNPPNSAHLKKLFPQFVTQERISAGFLIDQAGLKGQSVGGMQVSPKHAAFIVNTGGGKAADVIELIALIKKEVKNQFQVELKEEVAYL